MYQAQKIFFFHSQNENKWWLFLNIFDNLGGFCCFLLLQQKQKYLACFSLFLRLFLWLSSWKFKISAKSEVSTEMRKISHQTDFLKNRKGNFANEIYLNLLNKDAKLPHFACEIDKPKCNLNLQNLFFVKKCYKHISGGLYCSVIP